MDTVLKKFTYFFAAMTATAGLFVLDIAALAQAASCQQLNNSLRSLSRNQDFRSLRDNTQKARALTTQLRDAESRFVRSGCQKTLNAGQRLSRECRALARTILDGRKDYNRLATSLETGQAVAQQREVTLQQIARFGCQTNSNARVNTEQRDRPRSPFEAFLNRVFGGDQRIIESAPDYFNQSTLRTVCVRTCDGYYWPVSFSTVSEFLGDDAASCQAQAGNSNVELYYYNNPGEDADSMVSLQGIPYSAHPNAFLYRREFNPQCTTKPELTYGTIELSSGEDGEKARAQIQFGTLNFPLPMRDPRRTTELVVIQSSYVPLPRPRPVRDGEVTESAPRAALRAASGRGENARIITSGDKIVRIVGPDTPYAQAAAAGS